MAIAIEGLPCPMNRSLFEQPQPPTICRERYVASQRSNGVSSKLNAGFSLAPKSPLAGHEETDLAGSHILPRATESLVNPKKQNGE